MLLKKLSPLFIFLSFLVLILVSRGVQMNFLIEQGVTSYTTHLLISTGVNLCIVVVSFLFIRKHGLQDLAGIGMTSLLRPLLLLFPLYIVLLNVPDIVDIPTVNLLPNILVLMIYCISIGLSEELSLRGFLQSYVIKHFGNSKRSMLLSVIGVALIFGVMHLIKFDKGVFGEMSQVLYATFIGVMFGMLLLVTKRLAPLIIIHAIIDFTAKLDGMGIPKSFEGPKDPTSATQGLIVALIILPCLIYGLVISRYIKSPPVISIESNEDF